MYNASTINTNHKDIIFDIAYNHFGTRMATTSSNQNIKVWDKDKYGKWQLSSSWRSEDSSIWKLLWVHIEHGQILLTCSLNNVITIWQENISNTDGCSTFEDLFVKVKFNEHSINYNAEKVNENKYLRMSDEENLNSHKKQYLKENNGTESSKLNRIKTSYENYSNVNNFSHEGEPDIKKSKVDKCNQLVEAATVLKIVDTNFKENKKIINSRFVPTVNGKEKMVNKSYLSFNKWKKNSQINSLSPITDIKFGPRCLGLVFATCCTDGIIKLYEAVDETCLEVWTLNHEITSQLSWSCISWTDTFNEKDIPLIAVGCNSEMKPFQQPITRTSHQFGTRGPAENSVKEIGSSISTQYNKIMYELKIRIFEYHKINRILHPTNVVVEIFDPVNDLAFAPALNGCNYHTLAVASNNITIFKLEPEWDTYRTTMTYNVNTITKLNPKESNIWSLEWNMLGNVLISSGEDKCLRLWKNIGNHWRCTDVIQGDDSTKMHEVDNDSLNSLLTPKVFKLHAKKSIQL